MKIVVWIGLLIKMMLVFNGEECNMMAMIIVDVDDCDDRSMMMTMNLI